MNISRAIVRLAAGTALALAGAGLAGCLAGCKSTYLADVTNDSDRPIEAIIGPATKFIGPNDSGVVGPVSESGSMVLVVQEPGRPGSAEKLPLSSGTTAVTVQRMGPKGALVITETRRP